MWLCYKGKNISTSDWVNNMNRQLTVKEIKIDLKQKNNVLIWNFKLHQAIFNYIKSLFFLSLDQQIFKNFKIYYVFKECKVAQPLWKVVLEFQLKLWIYILLPINFPFRNLYYRYTPTYVNIIWISLFNEALFLIATHLKQNTNQSINQLDWMNKL